MRRHWMLRHTTFDHIESNLTTILGGKEYLQTHTLSPYFHEIGMKKKKTKQSSILIETI